MRRKGKKIDIMVNEHRQPLRLKNLKGGYGTSEEASRQTPQKKFKKPRHVPDKRKSLRRICGNKTRRRGGGSGGARFEAGSTQRTGNSVVVGGPTRAGVSET